MSDAHLYQGVFWPTLSNFSQGSRRYNPVLCPCGMPTVSIKLAV